MNHPDCAQTFVDHADGLTLHYGNPANTPAIDSRIKLIRKHFIAMSQGLQISPNETLPVVPCPEPTVRSR